MQSLAIPEVQPVEYCGQKVLSTIQIAQLLNCKRNNITDNFRNNKQQFIEGVDYFFIDGEELKAVKRAAKSTQNLLCAFSKYSTNTYLWTESGVEKISKYIGTDNAKLIYSQLRLKYFQGELVANKSVSPQINSRETFSRREKVALLNKYIDMTNDDALRDELIKHAANL